jgi:hypothetical protein
MQGQIQPNRRAHSKTEQYSQGELANIAYHAAAKQNQKGQQVFPK